MEPLHTRRIILAALALPALARASRAAPARAAGEEDALAVGAIFPLSGPLAVLGDESFRGLELAVEERNAAGGVLGRRLRLLKADATDPASAASEAKRLINERAAALFGTYSSTLAVAAAQAAELAGTPYFELGAGADALMERGLRGLFRACPTAGAVGAASVDAVAEVLAPLWDRPATGLRVALLHRDSLDGGATADAQHARMQVRGMVLADRVPYMRDTADLQPIVQRLRASEAEVVLHAGAVGDAPLLFGQFKRAGWTPRMVVGTGSAYALADTAAVVGPELEGVMTVDVAAYAVQEAACPGVGAAAAAYEKRYGMKPRSGHSLAGLVGARVFLDALHRAGGTERDRVRAAVLAADAPLGGTAAGWGVRFDERGQNGRARPVLLQWQGGALVSVGPEGVAVALPRARLGS